MKSLKVIMRNWLEIKDLKDLIKEERKELQETTRKLESNLEFWHKTFRTYSRIPCAHCGKQMHVYPYGGAYYERNGKKVHATCYDDFLNVES